MKSTQWKSSSLEESVSEEVVNTTPPVVAEFLMRNSRSICCLSQQKNFDSCLFFSFSKWWENWIPSSEGSEYNRCFAKGGDLNIFSHRVYGAVRCLPFFFWGFARFLQILQQNYNCKSHKSPRGENVGILGFQNGFQRTLECDCRSRGNFFSLCAIDSSDSVNQIGDRFQWGENHKEGTWWCASKFVVGGANVWHSYQQMDTRERKSLEKITWTCSKIDQTFSGLGHWRSHWYKFPSSPFSFSLKLV